MKTNSLDSKPNSVYLEGLLSESFSWKPGQLYIHKLNTFNNESINKRLTILQESGFIDNIKDVWIYSFVDPDVEAVFSVCGKPIKNVPSQMKTFNSYIDPVNMVFNKRIATNGFSLERISSSSMKTTYFLSSGTNVELKKLYTIDIEVVSTVIPATIILVTAWWLNKKMNLKPNKFGIGSIKFQQLKMYSLPQIFAKSNYLYANEMIISKNLITKTLPGEF